jgi:hypothetical protein
MPIHLKKLAELLPLHKDEETVPRPEPVARTAEVVEDPVEAIPRVPGPKCNSCGYSWRGWCAYEAPTFRNVEWISSCPKPEDAPTLNPSLEQRYGRGPLKLCRDCLVRTKCSRFIGLAWFFPGCPNFTKDN